jgi:hypothetical protein
MRIFNYKSALCNDAIKRNLLQHNDLQSAFFIDKTVFIDDIATLYGTSNWNCSTFDYNFPRVQLDGLIDCSEVQL